MSVNRSMPQASQRNRIGTESAQEPGLIPAAPQKTIRKQAKTQPLFLHSTATTPGTTTSITSVTSTLTVSQSDSDDTQGNVH